ncbi:MAG: hypothetical protein AB7U51_12550 [Arcobacter sp.]|uniref:hypothetical protein n=1 Tax=Arcobacter sp. TaxID=1872629 RepID=UPI003D05B0F0
MKDFIQVNCSSYSKSSLKSCFKHNVQREKNGEEIDYLLNEDNRLGNETTTFSYHVVSSGTYAENLRNFYATISKSNNYKALKDSFDFLENQRAEILKSENKKDYQTKHLVEFIVSLSEEKAKEYLDNGIDINIGFNQFSKDLEEKFNLNPLQISVHKDEGALDKENNVKHNIHAHIIAYNYNFIEKKSILANFKKGDFRQLQTLAQKSFNSVGLDFRRGVSKFKTKKVHLDRNDYILKKQNSELKHLRIEIENNQKKSKELYTLLNQQKNQLKELRTSFERDSNIYKMLSMNIKNFQQQEQQKREEHRILDEQLKVLKEKTKKQTHKIDDIEKFKKEIKEDLKEYLKQHTTKKDNKYFINNINSFYLNLVETFEFVSNLDIKIDELNDLKNKNEELYQNLQKVNSANINLKDELKKIELLNVKIKNLIDTNYKLENENYQLKSFIKDKNLEEDYKEFMNRSLDLNDDFMERS